LSDFSFLLTSAFGIIFSPVCEQGEMSILYYDDIRLSLAIALNIDGNAGSPPPTHPLIRKCRVLLALSSVADPDPYVFGPPGSGSVSTMYGSRSFYHQAKIVKKTFIPAVL
jgi:hypothetical protein